LAVPLRIGVLSGFDCCDRLMLRPQQQQQLLLRRRRAATMTSWGIEHGRTKYMKRFDVSSPTVDGGVAS